MRIHVDGELHPDTPVLVRVEVTGPVPPGQWRAALAELPGAVPVLAQPFGDRFAPRSDAAVAELAQRANRELGRRLRDHTGAVVVLYEGPAAAAMDLGVRLGARARAWPATAVPDAAGTPDDPAAAFTLGTTLTAPVDVLGPDGEVWLHVEDAAVTPRSERGDPLRDALTEAEEAWDQGRHTAAIDAVDALAVDPTMAVLAARRLAGWKQPVRAWHVADRVAAIHPDDVPLLETLAERCLALGRPHESRAALLRAAQLRPDRSELWARLARAALAQQDVPTASADVASGLAADPASPDLRDLDAACAALADDDDATERIAGAYRARPEAWPEAVARYLMVGSYDHVEILLAGRRDTLACGARAHVALWRGDLDGALREADVHEPLARLVRGAVAVLQGRPAEALPDLVPPPPGHPFLGPDTVLAWRTAALRALGDPSAHDTGRAAMIAGRHFNLGAHLERLLTVFPPDLDGRLDPGAWTHLAACVSSVVPTSAFGDGDMRAVKSAVETALERMGGNRTAWPSTVVDGRLTRLRHLPHPRHEGRLLQLQLRTRPIDEVLAGFDDLVTRFPDEPITWTYRGEVLLWIGAYERARAAFERALALDRETVWAWIGLGAVQALTGEHATALATWKTGSATVDYDGPTLFVYRGEVRRRMGDLRRARTNLDVALRTSPRRMSSWINRVLADDDPTLRERLIVHLTRVCPGLVHDAGDGDATTVLERMLALMCGNRSSSVVTWRVDGAPLRAAAWSVPGPPLTWFPSIANAPVRNRSQHRGRFQ